MKSPVVKSIGASFTIPICLFFLLHGNAVEVKGAGNRLRVLVDAGKDGGAWWFPQAPPNMNPKRPHQGQSMANSMRERGWEVSELPRGAVVTSEMLRSFDAVIRPMPFFGYNEREVAAYREAVSAGTRVLLIGAGGGDAVAEGFGLRFGPYSQISSVSKIIPLPLTVGSETLESDSSNNPVFRVLSIWTNEIPWVPLLEMPRDAVPLAWVNGPGDTENPILGYYRYNRGYILFIGTALGICDQGREWRDKLFAFLDDDYTFHLQRWLSIPPVTIEAAGPPPPFLVSPGDGDILPQPGMGSWEFTWEPVPGARKYQIMVLGARAGTPLVNVETRSTRFTMPSRGGYIVDMNLRGWTWRVRAQDADGLWGSWSETIQFDVAPMNSATENSHGEH